MEKCYECDKCGVIYSIKPKLKENELPEISFQEIKPDIFVCSECYSEMSEDEEENYI